MSQRLVHRKVCDRCSSETPATTSEKYAYHGDEFELDLCERHADMFQREILAWTRISRLVESPFKVFKSPSEAERERLRVRKEREARVATYRRIDLDAPKEVSLFDPEGAEDPLWPTGAAMDAMETLGLTWPQVVDAVTQAEVILPANDGVSSYLTVDLSVLVTPDNHVIGLQKRDPAEPLPKQPATRATKIVRRGKRGGVGSIGPRTTEDVIRALKERGWTIRHGGKHWKATGPEGQIATVPTSASDWRSTLNLVAQIRNDHGVDLRRDLVKTS